MSGYAHRACDAPIHCSHVESKRCLCCVPGEDDRQKYLDPALLFVRGAKDGRIVHFVQPGFEKTVSEYRSRFQWPDKSHPIVPYVPPKDMMRFGSKKEYAKIFPTAKPKEQNQRRWNKGIAEQIFEK